jgi:nucleotide-binding universal stress UspA family protein
MQEVSGMDTMRNPRVVVGVDDSLSGLEALRFATAEARRRGVGLRAVRAWQFATPWHEQNAGQYRAAMVDAAAMVLHDAFQHAMGGLPKDVTVEALAVEGPAARALADQANAPDDLLVVGRSGCDRGWWQVLGRIWNRLTANSQVDVDCVRMATCPVVTVGAPVLASDGTGHLARDVISSAEELLRDAARRPAQPA